MKKQINEEVQRMQRMAGIQKEEPENLPVGMPKGAEPIEEAGIPNNVKQFAARKGATQEVKAVAKWAAKLGKSIVGGTAIGKGYDTLILDLSYQGGEVSVDTEKGTIRVNGYFVTDFAEFKEALEQGDK